MTPPEIKALRERLGLTQAELAARLGLSRRETVADYEAGTVTPSGPVKLLLERLAQTK